MNRTPFIIAEIGINHNGSLAIARDLIDLAKRCGCDAVKFQKRTVETVYTREFLDGPRESPWGDTQRAQKEGLEFGALEFDEINEYCKRREIPWFGSAWDEASLGFLDFYEPPYHKIASAMATKPGFLKLAADTGRHLLVSTGGMDDSAIAETIGRLTAYGADFTLLHCVSKYPCSDDEANIMRMLHIKQTHQLQRIGYSGHEVGFVPTVTAAVLGADFIERHITLDRAMYGSDQAASLEGRGLELMVKYCRAAVEALGAYRKPDELMDQEAAILAKLQYWKD